MCVCKYIHEKKHLTGSLNKYQSWTDWEITGYYATFLETFHEKCAILLGITFQINYIFNYLTMHPTHLFLNTYILQEFKKNIIKKHQSNSLRGLDLILTTHQQDTYTTELHSTLNILNDPAQMKKCLQQTYNY